jgi:hypothetical protein
MSETCKTSLDPPLAPLKKGGTKRLEVPLFKGDLGGSTGISGDKSDGSNLL